MRSDKSGVVANSREKGKVYEQIRQRGCDITIGQREPEVAGVAAPYALAGSVTGETPGVVSTRHP